ncbi:MAG: Maf family nucleotide pyrophosphatase [Alphaproteobacteria bacterium]|nr:Maf family nucleotide pyrophosphatase [Alphaproteobacteria bacterium]
MVKDNLPLILGSASSERLVLLKSVGIIPDRVLSVDLDETEQKREKPYHYCKRVAQEKFYAVAKILEEKEAILITADTTAVASGKLLHKTYDDETLRKHIELISGKRHRVISAVCCGVIKNNKVESIRTKVVESSLTIKKMTNLEIESFIESKEGLGKAGGYTLKGVMACYVKQINGSFYSILGLPLHETYQLLNSLGYKK